MSTLRDYHVFKDSILMGPHMSAGGRHAIGGYVSGVYMGAEAAMTIGCAAVGWTPNEIATSMWLDAADSGTITLDTSRVSQWADKSGNERHVSQSASSARPVVTIGAQNGLNVVTFDGNDSLATAANFPETGDAEFSAFWVHTKDLSSAGSVFGWGKYNITGAASGFWDDGGQVYTGWAFAGGTSYKVESPSAGHNVWSYTKTPGNIAATSDIRKNGSNAATSGHSTVTPNIQGAPFVVGSYAGAGMFIGSLAELIICPTALSLTDRQILEGYLAHKWGLDGLLPANHPYKSTPPTV